MDARAMILGAGFGTRLRPLTDELPKPLVPVGDRPMLLHVVDRLASAGFTDLVLNAHHKTALIHSAIAELAVKVRVVDEVEIAGTAGGIAGARGLFARAPILVWNGDVLARPPAADLLARAEDTGLCFAVAPRPAGAGTLGCDARGDVVRLRGEVFGDEVRGGDYVGIAALGADVLAALPSRGCLVADVALPRLREGGRIATAEVAGPWRDVGSLAEYGAANQDWLDGYEGPRRARTSFVHESARVAPGVSVERSVVGAGAVVEGRGVLERSVVWPGARAVAPLHGVVVTTSGRVVELR